MYWIRQQPVYWVRFGVAETETARGDRPPRGGDAASPEAPLQAEFLTHFRFTSHYNEGQIWVRVGSGRSMDPHAVWNNTTDVFVLKITIISDPPRQLGWCMGWQEKKNKNKYDNDKEEIINVYKKCCTIIMPL